MYHSPPARYRAWHADEHKMIHFGLFDTDQGYDLDSELGLNECPIMAATGIKGLNGVELYEHDIVQHGSLRLTVVWKWWKWILQGGERPTYDGDRYEYEFGNHLSSHDIQQLEVVGNIYETPDAI